MADVCADIIDELRADPTVRNLVRPDICRQGAGGDRGSVRLDATPRRRTVRRDGGRRGTAGQGIPGPRVRSDDPTEAVELADAVRAALDGRRGRLGYGVYSCVSVIDTREGIVPKNLDAEELLHISSLDVEISGHDNSCDVSTGTCG